MKGVIILLIAAAFITGLSIQFIEAAQIEIVSKAAAYGYDVFD